MQKTIIFKSFPGHKIEESIPPAAWIESRILHKRWILYNKLSGCIPRLTGESDKKVLIYHGVNLAINFLLSAPGLRSYMPPGALSLGISYAILNVNHRVQQARKINDFHLLCKALGGFFIGWKVWGLSHPGTAFFRWKIGVYFEMV